MQKRDQSKLGGASGGLAAPAAKRGRPFGSGTNYAAAVAAVVGADSAAPSILIDPSLQVRSAFAEQQKDSFGSSKWTKCELTKALNALILLSFKEKDEVRKDATPLAKIPGVFDALLQVIDDWREIALPRVLTKTPRVRLLGMNTAVTGFGNGYETGVSVPPPSTGSGSPNEEASAPKTTTKPRPSGWWFEEDGLFNLDEEGRAEKQLCAVAVSNILRNFSFMADGEIAMSQSRHCLDTMFQCLEDNITEDKELVTNALETIMNLWPLIDLGMFLPSKSFKITPKRVVQVIMAMLGSPVKAWQCATAELLGRLILNPYNETFLQSFASQIYSRLVDMMSIPSTEAQATAIGALYNFCRNKFGLSVETCQ